MPAPSVADAVAAESTAPNTALRATPGGEATLQASSEAPLTRVANANFPSLEFTLDSGTRPSPEVDKFDFGYVKGYFTDAGKLLSSPLRWDGQDWMKAGVVAGVTSSLFLVDDNIKTLAQSSQNKVGRGVASFGNFVGYPIYALPPLAGLYLYGYFKDDHKARRVSLLALESFSMTGLMTEGLKRVVGRHRPNTGDEPGTMDGPKLSAKNFSFASGHTSSSFALATIFANEYKDSAYVPPVAYGLATLVALSRIYSNAHWASDTFAGAALGYFTSKAILAFHKEKDNRLSIVPQFGNGVAGLTVGYKF